MPRPPKDPGILAEALRLVASGLSPRGAEDELASKGRVISHMTIRRALATGPGAPAGDAAAWAGVAAASAAQPVAPRPGLASTVPAPPAERAGMDAEGTPLEVMRALLADVGRSLLRLDVDSPKRGPLVGRGRELAKAISGLEAEHAKKETPEESAARKRREDNETRKALERYVLQAELEAAQPREGAPFGVCVHCAQPLPRAIEANP